MESLTGAVCGEARPARSGLLWQHLEAGGGAEAQEEEEQSGAWLHGASQWGRDGLWRDGWTDERMEEMTFLWFRCSGYPAGPACSCHTVPTWYFKAACLGVDQSEQATP